MPSLYSILSVASSMAMVSALTPYHSPSPSACNSCTTSICADYINSCGQTYGGCFPACEPYTTPSFQDPGCPTTTSHHKITTSTGKHHITTTPTTTGKPTTCTSTICEDHFNDCGQTYGGCYEACSGYTKPVFTDPGCPTTTSKPITTSKPTSKPATCTETICVDTVNSCGQTYGGCYPICSGYTKPLFIDPGCPTTTQPPTSTPTSTCTESICVDSINSCGQTYGGCYAICSGYTKPVFTDPGCPTTTSNGIATITPGTVTSVIKDPTMTPKA